MLDTVHGMEENVKELEIVSDAEEMAVTLDSEHEEGEISEDDDDVDVAVSDQHKSFSHLYPSEYHSERQPGKKSSATSAVVIYDDQGRTAIFTSPRKKAWDPYKRRGEPRRWQQGEMEKRRQNEDGRKHQLDNGKENKRSGAGRARSRTPVKDVGTYKRKAASKRSLEKTPPKKLPPDRPLSNQDKEGRRTSPTRDSTSKFSKSWGSNIKSAHTDCHTLTVTSSRKLTGKSQHVKHKSKLKDNVLKVSDAEAEVISDDSQSDTLMKGNIAENPLMSSQKQLPRGSFGEMLLKKKLKGKLKIQPQANKIPEKEFFSGEVEENKKENLVDFAEGIHQDCYTLDQEDEDELQLRLIALQSSLKVLSDVRREGYQSANAENIDVTMDGPQDSISQPLKEIRESKDLSNADNEQKERISTNKLPEHIQSTAEGSSQIESKTDFDASLHSDTIKEEINLMLDDFSQSSTRSHPGSSITGIELELDAISTNRSYLDEGEDSTRQLATNIEEHLQREMKDLADSNQDPIDMDICDSSPGEDDNFDEDVLKDVGEDISLDKVSFSEQSTSGISSQAKSYLINNDPGGPESFHHTGGSGNKGNSSSKSNNNSFQIPVEWAYMMPPPPPPDQPPNDISNINSWCYDQNMYLQTMQSSYDSSEQYQHYSTYGTATADWRLQQQHPSLWNESKSEGYENLSEVPENDQDSAQAIASSDEKAENNLQTSEKEISNTNSSPQEDLKDLPAEHYQAFMSVVLNQQKSNCTSRNLIEVQLTKSSSNLKVDNAIVGPSSGAILQVNKRSRARRRKRERQKEKIKQLKQLKAMEKISKEAVVAGQSDHPSKESIPNLSDEEDEDLLRAQLLIDLSRKKQQKQTEPLLESVEASFSKHQLVTHQDRFDSSTSCYVGHESTPPLSYPSSLESSPRLRPVSKSVLTKLHQQQVIRENSPTHIMKSGMRRGLSDIGGFGLDPKSSRYDFPVPKDVHSQKDIPKFKFPNIKPVIINLESDSDSDEAMEMGESSSHSIGSAEESKPADEGILSSSIDLLLKSMRNAHKPGTEPLSGKPTKSRVLVMEHADRTLIHKSPPLDTTLNVVRHLSRTQQVEYRKLKEQLREKEMLQKKRREQLLRQKTMNKKMASNSERFAPESPQSGDFGGDASDGGQEMTLRAVSPDKEHDPIRKLENSTCQNDGKGLENSILETREVIFKGAGGLQIQLPNISTANILDESSFKICTNHKEVVDSQESLEINKNKDVSNEASVAEDEDEEMLRLMVLKTLQKKTVDKVNEVNDNCIVSEGESVDSGKSPMRTSSSRTLKVSICQKLDDISVEEKEVEDTSEFSMRKVVIEDQIDLQERPIEIHSNEVDHVHVWEVGEWMVLDEVLEEAIEGNGDNASEEALKVSKTEKSNIGKTLVSDNHNEGLSNSKANVPQKDEKEHYVHDRDGSPENKKITLSEFNEKVCTDKAKDVSSPINVTSEFESTINEICKGTDSEFRINQQRAKFEFNVPEKMILCSNKDEDAYKNSTQQVPNEVSRLIDEIVTETENKDKVEVEVVSLPQHSSNDQISSKITDCSKILCVTQNDEMTIVPCVGNNSILSGTPKEITEEIKSTEERNYRVRGVSSGDIGKETAENRMEIPELTQSDTLHTLISESTKNANVLVDINTPLNTVMEEKSAIRMPNIKNVIHNSNEPGNTSETSVVNKKSGLTAKPLRTKRLLLLKRVEHEYTQKRIAMNEVISQLASLVHEATEEERQRQTLRLTVTKLREKLKLMETQLEDKACKLKAKMARIRSMQTRITKDREEISQLERKGEILGKEELGSDYKLPKVLGSPHSKSKDHMRKKQLAHNIDALRQQIGQMYNKNQARLQAAYDPRKKLESSVKKRKMMQQHQNLYSRKNIRPTPLTNDLQALGDNGTVFNMKLGSSSSVQTKESANITHPVSKTKVQIKRKVLLEGGNVKKINKADNSFIVLTDNETPQIIEHLSTDVTNQEIAIVHPYSVTSQDSCMQKLPLPEHGMFSEKTEKIDEMNMLCPYDLLGRCNDDSCMYQHVRDPRQIRSKSVNSEGNKPSSIVQTSVTDAENILEDSKDKADFQDRRIKTLKTEKSLKHKLDGSFDECQTEKEGDTNSAKNTQDEMQGTAVTESIGGELKDVDQHTVADTKMENISSEGQEDEKHENIDMKSKGEVNVSIVAHDTSCPGHENQDQYPESSPEECIKRNECLEMDKSVLQPSESLDENDEIAMKLDIKLNTSKADKSDGSGAQEKYPPKRCIPRKRTRNSDPVSDLALMSESSEVVPRRTRGASKNDVPRETVTGIKNKKRSQKEKPAPAKTSPRRLGRKTRGVKR